MPTSMQIELQLREKWQGSVLFQHREDEITVRIPDDLWLSLGSPTGLRVRIEDTFNDPARTR